MKTLNFYPLLIFILFTFLLGCNEFIDKYESTWEYKYAQLIKKSLEKEKPSNMAFLNFELGMSAEAFNYHENALAQKKIIVPVNSESTTKFISSTNKVSQYKFDLLLKSGKHDVVYKPLFEDGKLVQIHLEVLPKVVGSDLTKLYQEVIQVYRKKYGKDFLEKKQVFGSNDFFWFDSNKQIKLSQNALSINVSYSDLNWLDIGKESCDESLLEKDNVELNDAYKYL